MYWFFSSCNHSATHWSQIWFPKITVKVAGNAGKCVANSNLTLCSSHFFNSWNVMKCLENYTSQDPLYRDPLVCNQCVHIDFSLLVTIMQDSGSKCDFQNGLELLEMCSKFKLLNMLQSHMNYYRCCNSWNSCWMCCKFKFDFLKFTFLLIVLHVYFINCFVGGSNFLCSFYILLGAIVLNPIESTKLSNKSKLHWINYNIEQFTLKILKPM